MVRRLAAAVLQRAPSCACGGGCPRCQAELPPRVADAADFSQVRIHPAAPEVTGPLRARAATRGQDIYFHPGQFRPDTAEGESLIAHELAHTLQTRQSPNTAGQNAGFVSQPGDALENNADALVRGDTAHATAAPAGATLRTPFDAENATDRARRQALIQSISNAIQHVVQLLSSGGLIQGAETPVERGGVRGVIYGRAGSANEFFTSYAARDAMLRRVSRSLVAMATSYRSAPIPGDFSAPTVDPEGNHASTVQRPAGSGRGSSTYTAMSAEAVDLSAAYERYCISIGMQPNEYFLDWFYLDADAIIVAGAARGAPRIGSGIATGVYVVVPDIDHEPLRYWRLYGNSPTPPGSVIVEFWNDDLGYYYPHRGQRVDVPSPWSE